MKRVLLAIVGTVAVLVFLLGFKTSPAVATHPIAAAQAPKAPNPTSTGSVAATPSAAPSVAPSAASSTAAAAPAAPKTYVGQAVDTRYGPVQVQITVADGKITQVQAVQMPGGDPRDDEITQFSAPQLAQEALAAQSAQIDVVSGATYTSDGYAQSLQSAIDQWRG